MTITIATEEADLSNQTRTFKVSRDQQTLIILRQNANQHWEQVEGNIDQQQVNIIGAAIAAQYP